MLLFIIGSCWEGNVWSIAYSGRHCLGGTPPSFLISKGRLNARQFLSLDLCGEDERHKNLCLDCALIDRRWTVLGHW